VPDEVELTTDAWHRVATSDDDDDDDDDEDDSDEDDDSDDEEGEEVETFAPLHPTAVSLTLTREGGVLSHTHAHMHTHIHTHTHTHAHVSIHRRGCCF
jgi:hypothetical protein